MEDSMLLRTSAVLALLVVQAVLDGCQSSPPVTEGSGGSAGSSAANGGSVPAGTGGGGASGSAGLVGTGGTTVIPDAGPDSGRTSIDAASESDAAGNATSALAALPPQPSILAAMRSANAYFVAKWPDPTIDIVTDKARPSNLWTRAVYYEGLMALYAVEPDMARRTTYYNYAVTWGASSSHPWQVAYGDNTSTSADNQACGQTYIDLYKIDAQPVRIANIQANIDGMIANHVTNVWTWVDAIQMSMPVFAKLGVLTGKTSYFDAMWSLYSDARDTEGGGFYDKQAHLWWRDATFTPDAPTHTTSPGGQEIYWSRGNGWALAALVRVLDTIPSNETHRPQYLADFRALAAALLPLQRSDGFWNESLTNPTHCQSIGRTGQDGPETSGTALFAYGIAWGIRQGVLDAPTYGSVLARAWNGLSTVALQSNGFLGWVQSTGSAPCDSATTGLGANVVPNFEDYGLGAFLLAGSEVYKLAQ
jgi:rhamnogalacturonyl hydrolase YesR